MMEDVNASHGAKCEVCGQVVQTSGTVGEPLEHPLGIRQPDGTYRCLRCHRREDANAG